MKQQRYKKLVEERKKYRFSDTEIVNPSELTIENDEHLNARIYGLKREPMKKIVERVPVILPDGKKLFVVYHCSNLGIANRDFNSQRLDWRKMKEAI